MRAPFRPSHPSASFPPLPQAAAAQAAYEEALAEPDIVSGGAQAALAHRAECEAGLARCAILAGEVDKGMELAGASASPQLLAQCAELLDRRQHPKEVGGCLLWCCWCCHSEACQ
jgi:WD repeat-containing protein 19